MAVSDETTSNNPIPVSSQSSFKFNLKLDSTHGNDIQRFSFHGCDDDECKNVDDNDVGQPEQNVNVIVTLQTSVHSVDFSESKLDDDSHLSQSLNDDELNSLDQEECFEENDDVDATESSIATVPKRTLVVRTLEESLSSPITSRRKSYDAVKKISFSALHIREYELLMIENPACGSGPPIAIGNKFTTKDTVLLNENDVDSENDLSDTETREEIRKKKKANPYGDLYLKAHDRLSMVRKQGYTDKEICECIVAVREAQKIRNKNAIADLKEEEKKEVINEAKKKVKKVLFRSKEQKERDRLAKSFFNANKQNPAGFRNTI